MENSTTATPSPATPTTLGLGLWVNWNGAAGAWCSPDGRPVAWRRDALAFASLESAEAYATARGWELSTSAAPGRTTAYVADLGVRS